MTKKNILKVRSKIWIYTSHNSKTMQGAWHFVTIPKKTSAEIKKRFGDNARGWGSLPVKVTLGKTSWRTSIFPDKKLEAYVLPIKLEVRRKEDVGEGDNINFSLEIKI